MIRLFGGEAFLHPEWKRIVEHARDQGLHCTAVSNGMRLARMIKGARYVELVGVGHLIPLEAPEMLTDVIQSR